MTDLFGNEISEEVDKKTEIIEDYLNYVKDYRRFPTYTDLSFSQSAIRHHFGNITNLTKHVRENHDLKSLVGLQEDLFRKVDEIETAINGRKTFFITTAVADSPAHDGFLKSIDTFSRAHGAAICIMPCESVTNSFENQSGVFSHVFNDTDKYIMISDNVNLNDNLYLASIQVSAKQIKPITGLARVGSRDGSYIVASPKQFLEYVSSGHVEGKTHAVMTTGACTEPRYYSDVFVSKRLSYIADHDHVIGGIIVDVINDREFHFRHVEADNSGAFVDLGKRYTPNGIEEYKEVSATLEIHTGQTDLVLLDRFISNMGNLNVKNVYLHDVFDAFSINHHIENSTFAKAKRSEDDVDSLKDELIKCGKMIEKIAHSTPGTVYIVKSNHDEFLDRYMESGRYAYDPVNLKTVFEIGSGMFEGGDFLEYAISKYMTIPDNVVFLSRKDSMKVGNREMAAHGDLGQNGGPAGLNGIEKVYGECLIGHAHSPAIQRGVFRMGTMTKLDMGYNRGPSTWVNGFGLAYENGKAQLVNFINGEFK